MRSTTLLYITAVILICSSLWALFHLVWMTNSVIAYAEDATRDNNGDPVQLAATLNSYFGTRARTTFSVLTIVNAISGILIAAAALRGNYSRKLQTKSVDVGIT